MKNIIGSFGILGFVFFLMTATAHALLIANVILLSFISLLLWEKLNT